MERSGKIVGALLLGAAVGAALGILLAPGEGSETRKKFMKSARDLADELADKVKKSAENIMREAGKMEDEFESQMDHEQNPSSENTGTEPA